MKAKHPFLGWELYVVPSTHEHRLTACLYHKNTKRRKSMAYARYLVCVKEGRTLTAEESVDHIDGNTINDELGNLQILTPRQNNAKSKCKPIRPRTCANCSKEFIPKRNYDYKPVVNCSRKCGYEMVSKQNSGPRY